MGRVRSVRRRINKSLSDLDGTDAYIHDGTIHGVFREMGNAFVGSARQPTVAEMQQIYRVLRTQLPGILRNAGAADPFNARVVKDSCILASKAADELIT